MSHKADKNPTDLWVRTKVVCVPNPKFKELLDYMREAAKRQKEHAIAQGKYPRGVDPRTKQERFYYGRFGTTHPDCAIMGFLTQGGYYGQALQTWTVRLLARAFEILSDASRGSSDPTQNFEKELARQASLSGLPREAAAVVTVYVQEEHMVVPAISESHQHNGCYIQAGLHDPRSKSIKVGSLNEAARSNEFLIPWRCIFEDGFFGQKSAVTQANATLKAYGFKLVRRAILRSDIVVGVRDKYRDALARCPQIDEHDKVAMGAMYEGDDPTNVKPVFISAGYQPEPSKTTFVEVVLVRDGPEPVPSIFGARV